MKRKQQLQRREDRIRDALAEIEKERIREALKRNMKQVRREILKIQIRRGFGGRK